MNKPKILVTNDDGITAQGIKTLVSIASDYGDVLVVAPDSPQSGMSHAITIHDFLRLHPNHDHGDVEAYSCTGTPVDCVKLGIYKVWKGKKPDLVLSGINHGANCSVNVIYSGTMAGAIEGAIENIPSVGFSLLDHSMEANFKSGEKFIRQIIEETLKNKLAPHTCLNVNIPAVEKPKGIKICTQANVNWKDDFLIRKDPSGKEYYWLTGKFDEQEVEKGSDLYALKKEYVSIVPVQTDLTHYNSIEPLKNWNL